MTTAALSAELASAGLDVHSDRPLAPLTTYGVGGNCLLYTSPSPRD